MLISQLAEWLTVAISWKLLWPTISSTSVTDTVTVGVQEILLTSFVPAWLETRTYFTCIIK